MDAREFNSIIDMAIAFEVEACEFYRDVAAKVTDASLKNVFQGLAGEEQGHKASLEKIKAKELQNFTFTGATDYKILETLELPKLSMDMKPSEAIALAMQKEDETVRMYASLAKASTDSEKQEVFMNLAEMEKGHKAKLEGIYTQTAFPEVW